LEGHLLPPSCTPEVTPVPMLGCYVAYGPCRSCRRGAPGSLPGCFVWDLWCTFCHQDRVFFEYFLFCHYYSAKFINASVFRRMGNGTIRDRSSTDSLTPSQGNEETMYIPRAEYSSLRAGSTIQLWTFHTKQL